MYFLDILKKHAKTDKIAAFDPAGVPLTYKDLEARSDALACYFSDLPSGSAVIIRGDKENDILTVMLACLKSGHPYSFVASFFPDDKLVSIMTLSDASLLVNFGDSVDAELNAEVLTQADIDRISQSGKSPDSSLASDGDDTACIFFTSGSTGVPKGVVITVSNIEHITKWWGVLADFGICNPRIVNFSSYGFSSSLYTVYTYMLYLGGCLFAISKELSKDYSLLCEKIAEINPHYIDSTPSFFDICIRSDEKFGSEKLPSLKFISVGGEPTTATVGKMILDRFPNVRVYNGYGATEATAGHLVCRLTDDIIDSNGPLPIGFTPKGSYIQIVDEHRNPVPDGTPGELVMISKMISKGYLKDPERTAKMFFEAENGMRGYYSGDLVVKNEDGSVTYLGRTNNLVKIGGYRIELEEVELRINEISGVHQSVAVPVYRGLSAVMLASFIVLKDGIPQSSVKETIRIKQQLKKYLPEYMVPQKIIFVEEFPKNANGKTDRKALIEKIRLE